jgi:hypothetical protein
MATIVEVRQFIPSNAYDTRGTIREIAEVLREAHAERERANRGEPFVSYNFDLLSLTFTLVEAVEELYRRTSDAETPINGYSVTRGYQETNVPETGSFVNRTTPR